MGLGVNARIAPMAREASAQEAPKILSQCNKTVGVSLLVCPDVTRVLKGKTCVDHNGNRCRILKVSIGGGQNHVLRCAKKIPDLILQ